MQIQVRRMSKLGDFMNLPDNPFGNPKAIPGFQNLPGGAFANPGLLPGGFQNIDPGFFGEAKPLPGAAPPPAAPGAVLPTNAPTYLFPVNQEASAQTPAPAAETSKASKGLSTSTLVIGGLVVVGVIAAVALLKD